MQELVEEYKDHRDFDAEIYQWFGNCWFGIPIWPEDLGETEILMVEFGKKEPDEEVPVLGYMLIENVVIG